MFEFVVSEQQIFTVSFMLIEPLTFSIALSGHTDLMTKGQAGWMTFCHYTVD